MLPHPKVKYNTHLYLANMYCLDATKKCGDLNSNTACFQKTVQLNLCLSC